MRSRVDFYSVGMNQDAIRQGYKARKVISEECASFVLQCILSLGGSVNTRRMSNRDMESIFHIKHL